MRLLKKILQSFLTLSQKALRLLHKTPLLMVFFWNRCTSLLQTQLHGFITHIASRLYFRNNFMALFQTRPHDFIQNKASWPHYKNAPCLITKIIHVLIKKTTTKLHVPITKKPRVLIKKVLRPQNKNTYRFITKRKIHILLTKKLYDLITKIKLHVLKINKVSRFYISITIKLHVLITDKLYVFVTKRTLCLHYKKAMIPVLITKKASPPHS